MTKNDEPQKYLKIAIGLPGKMRNQMAPCHLNIIIISPTVVMERQQQFYYLNSFDRQNNRNLTEY